MPFLGEYELTITDGSVLFPEKFKIAHGFKWAIFSLDNEKLQSALILKNPDDMIENPNDKILVSGLFTLNNDGTWTLPASVLDFLKDDEIVLIGMMDHIELYSKKAYKSELLKTSGNLEKILSDLSIFE